MEKERENVIFLLYMTRIYFFYLLLHLLQLEKDHEMLYRMFYPGNYAEANLNELVQVLLSIVLIFCHVLPPFVVLYTSKARGDASKMIRPTRAEMKL
jgi:hypothetical protein